jgi:hypothetical protein
MRGRPGWCQEYPRRGLSAVKILFRARGAEGERELMALVERYDFRLKGKG